MNEARSEAFSGHPKGAGQVFGELLSLGSDFCRDLHLSRLLCQVFAVPERAQREIVIPVAVGRFAVALMTYRWRQKAMEPCTDVVQDVGSGTERLDEPGRADHRFEDRSQESAISADAIDVGSDSDEFALCIELDVAPVTPVCRSVHIQDRRHHPIGVNSFGIPDHILFRLIDKAGPEKSERLRGAVPDPGTVVVARSGVRGSTSHSY